MKKVFALLLAIVLVLSMTACVSTKPAETIPKKPGEATAAKFTVVVVHGDGTQKEFTYETEEKVLGDYLETQGLIVSQGADDGMFHTVDGEKADWNENQSYWAFYLSEEYAMTGIYDTQIENSAVYKLVYTKG